MEFINWGFYFLSTPCCTASSSGVSESRGRAASGVRVVVCGVGAHRLPRLDIWGSRHVGCDHGWSCRPCAEFQEVTARYDGGEDHLRCRDSNTRLGRLPVSGTIASDQVFSEPLMPNPSVERTSCLRRSSAHFQRWAG